MQFQCRRVGGAFQKDNDRSKALQTKGKDKIAHPWSPKIVESRIGRDQSRGWPTNEKPATPTGTKARNKTRQKASRQAFICKPTPNSDYADTTERVHKWRHDKKTP